MYPPNQDPFDPKYLSIPGGVAIPKPSPKSDKAEGKREKRFIYKKPWGWACAAAKLPGKAGIVGDGIWLLRGLEKSDTVKWRPGIGAELGLTYHTFYRGLAALEAAGLVRVERHCGRSPVITIIRNFQGTADANKS